MDQVSIPEVGFRDLGFRFGVWVREFGARDFEFRIHKLLGRSGGLSPEVNNLCKPHNNPTYPHYEPTH